MNSDNYQNFPQATHQIADQNAKMQLCQSFRESIFVK